MNLGIKDITYVFVQFFLFGTYLLKTDFFQIKLPEPFNVLCLAICLLGIIILIVSLLQLNTNLSPFPSPKSNSTLITNGIYKYIRHPIYTGIILATFGYGLYTSSLYKIIISLLLYTLFYFKSSYEEERLKINFPDYKLYQKKSGRFFPKI